MMQQSKINTATTHIHKRLSVQVSLIGHSFLVHDDASPVSNFYVAKNYNTICTPEEVLVNIKKEIENTPLLQQSFKEVVVVYTNSLATTVPATLFNEEKAVEYLKFNTKILATDYVAHDLLANKELVNVYVPFVNINNYFIETVGSFKYYHSSTLLIEQALRIEPNKKEHHAYVNVQDDYFQLICLSGNDLILSNHFTYKTKEDFLYYVLFCLEQLQWSPEETPFYLSGNITTQSDLYRLLYKYIRHIALLQDNALNRYAIEKVATHQKNVLKLAAHAHYIGNL